MDREPDRLEKGVRFGCGTLFGLIIGFVWAIQSALDFAVSWILLPLALALVCGFLAAKYGDDFWHKWLG
jgi:hypothetical protein